MFASSPVDILAWQRIINGHRALTAAAKSVAFEISLHIFSATGTAWPSMKRLAERTNLDISTAKRAVKQLVRLGLVAVRRTGRSHLYRLLIGGTGATSESAPLPPKRADGKVNLPPTPEESQIVLDLELEPTPAPPSAPATPSADTDASPEPENAAAVDSDAADEARAIIIALIAASGAQYSTKPGSGPMRAAQKALKAGYTVDQIKTVIAWCASTWSNPKFLTPSAVLRIDRLDERVAAAQAAAPAGTRQQAHRLFEREEPIERAKPATVANHLAALKAALSGCATPS